MKIVGVRSDYHELSSRFVLLKNLYDEIFIRPKNPKDEKVFSDLMIRGECGCEIEKNTIYKTYKKILEFLEKNIQNEKINQINFFFEENEIFVQKNIPIGSGLGGGSSNSASFLIFINNFFNLNLSQKDLFAIGEQVGADVNFFISGYESANVKGIGEIVEKFDEKLPNFEIILPNIICETKKVFQEFRANFLDLKNIDVGFVQKLQNMKTLDILTNYNAIQLNDLLAPSLKLYPDLQKYFGNGLFFSGSGSTFFRMI